MFTFVSNAVFYVEQLNDSIAKYIENNVQIYADFYHFKPL